MAVKIGINGFGRIGKLVFRLLQERPEYEIAGINDPADIKILAQLLRFDSVHGRFSGEVEIKGQSLVVNGRVIPVFHEKFPADIPRTLSGADIVVESSGVFLTRNLLKGHIDSGAGKVILTCPAAEPLDKTIIIGINDHELNSTHHIVSNASCTANCVAPLLRVMDEAFGIEMAYMNTVHPATNNQRLIDAPHSDPRRSRTALNNIIPTTSTAIPVILDLMPQLRGRFDGLATRVPVSDGSLIELSVLIKTDTRAESVNEVFNKYAQGPLKGILEYSSDPLVSTDILGNPSSAVFDSLSTRVLRGKFVQIIGWYDNEYGYSNRVVDLISKMTSLM